MKQVKSILKHIGQETNIACFSLRNTNHPILDRKDGKEIFIHRIVTTKKELCRYRISTNSECIYCGEPDSINHTFIDCEFTKTFACKVINWFNTQHGLNFQPDTKEMLLATFKHPTYMKPVRKFNYTSFS